MTTHALSRQSGQAVSGSDDSDVPPLVPRVQEEDTDTSTEDTEESDDSTVSPNNIPYIDQRLTQMNGHVKRIMNGLRQVCRRIHTRRADRQAQEASDVSSRVTSNEMSSGEDSDTSSVISSRAGLTRHTAQTTSPECDRAATHSHALW